MNRSLVDRVPSTLNYNTNVNYTTCHRCKKKFHKDNFAGHERWELEVLENSLKNQLVISEKIELKELPFDQNSNQNLKILNILEKNTKINNKNNSDHSDMMLLDKGLHNHYRELLLKKGKKWSEEKSNEICKICNNFLKEDEEIIILPVCLHSFHLNHLMYWLNSHSVCPVCNIDIKQGLEN